jgi:pimeloyl-ACP methyl ester carboxylesterase
LISYLYGELFYPLTTNVIIQNQNTTMKNFKQILFLTFILTPLFMSAQQNQRFNGPWMGKLNVGAIQFRLGVNLSVDNADKINALLDSPDQDAFGIKTDTTIISGDNITIKVKKLMAGYEGTIVQGDSLINGKWTQGGQTFDLNLKKMLKPVVLNRPQEPKPPFPYKSKDVTFLNEKANIELAGTLTIPEGKGPFPAVVMVTGSGAQDRDEALMGHKPFLVISDYLTRNGIAVLRYDDRGFAKSKGVFATSTTYDFADDAEAGLMWLRKQPLIDINHIGIAGHSEGGLIAPIVASRNNNVNFIILLAGPGISGEDIILAQTDIISQKSGIKPEEIKKTLMIDKEIFDVIIKEQDKAKATAAARKIMEDAVNNDKSTTDVEKSAQLKSIDGKIAQLTSDWFLTFIKLDPKPYLLKTKCPVLALNGTKDVQVPYKVDLEAIDKYLKSAGNKHYIIMKIEGVNHLFQHADTGLPTEYGNIEETFAPEALKAMSDFILKLK